MYIYIYWTNTPHHINIVLMLYIEYTYIRLWCVHWWYSVSNWLSAFSSKRMRLLLGRAAYIVDFSVESNRWARQRKCSQEWLRPECTESHNYVDTFKTWHLNSLFNYLILIILSYGHFMTVAMWTDGVWTETDYILRVFLCTVCLRVLICVCNNSAGRFAVLERRLFSEHSGFALGGFVQINKHRTPSTEPFPNTTYTYSYIVHINVCSIETKPRHKVTGSMSLKKGLNMSIRIYVHQCSDVSIVHGMQRPFGGARIHCHRKYIVAGKSINK